MKAHLPARLKKFIQRLILSVAPVRTRRSAPQQLDLFPGSPQSRQTPNKPEKPRGEKVRRTHAAPRFENWPPSAAC